MPRWASAGHAAVWLIVAAAGARTPASAQGAAPQTPPRIRQDVVVTATLAPVPTDSLSRTTTVVTRDEIDELGLDSVIDALRLVPGVDARARGPRGVQTDFSIRGATFGQNLVLADGQRLNDSQSGHHNGEIPLPAVAIDRIEIVSGAGSASHGADALGGTINVISRTDRHRVASIAAGQHGYFDVQASASVAPLPPGWMVAGWASRSSGFTFDRDFAMGGGALRGSAGRGWTFDVRHQRRAFGANGFYGDSPSKEWTDQTLAGAGWQTVRGAWATQVHGLVRNHGDHFRWDINRPGFAENRHRTNAVEASVTTGRPLRRGGTITFGASAGGDWVDSSNLGDRRYARASGFAEWQQRVGAGTTTLAGLRVDRYSSFGSAASPSLSVVTTLAPGIRARASLARAFRVPTFTELYYSDPNSLGNPDLRPERGWSLDGGLDAAWRGGWTTSISVFRRWDEDVIDYVRPAGEPPPSRAMNIRDVTSTGVEASLSRRWSRAVARLSYAGLTVDAPPVALTSRYLLEYARHQASASLALPVAAGVRLALTVDHRDRLDGQTYALVGFRVSRAWGPADVFVDGTNVFDAEYHEIAGVAMPGRWITAGVAIR